MNITIAERLKPFSHQPGTYCVLPGTALRLQVFPALIRVHDLSLAEPRLIEEIPVPIQGPVKQFTVQLDLEKGLVHVWGFDSQGYFAYQIFAAESSAFTIKVEKGLSDWSPTQVLSTRKMMPLTDRLSLGCHKSQEWENVQKRGDLAEIFPHWLRLGQLVPVPEKIAEEGTASLLKTCREASKLEVYSVFQNLFHVGFEGVLSPRLVDTQHQGFGLTEPSDSISPLVLLTEGAKAIRSLFVICEEDRISILSNLPPQFHCGRYLHVKCPQGLLDMEWTKKTIRRMMFYADKACSIQFQFPKDVKECRLNGKKHRLTDVVHVEKDQVYTFDRFCN